MTKEWFTSAELAGISGMPKTVRGVRIKAEKSLWLSRAKTKGQGFEYHVSNFPDEVKAALLSNEAAGETSKEISERVEREIANEATKEQLNSESQMQELAKMPVNQSSLVLARLELLSAYNQFLSPYKKARQLTVGEKLFVEQYNSGALQMPNWVKVEIPTVSVMTIRRWKAKRESSGTTALADAYKKTKASTFERYPEVAEFVLALITAKPHLMKKSREVANLIDVKRRELYKDWPQVSASAVQRHLEKLSQSIVTELAYTTNPREFNNSHRPLFGRMYPWISGPNQVWELDSTPTDVQLNVEGKARRYSIIGAIDVFTRRLKVVLMPASSSEGICLLLRKCLLDWGIPEPDSVIRTDNGSDYVSKTTIGIFNLLQLNQSRANAFSGWEKPFIERAFKTLSHGLMEKLPAYQGHNVADKKRLQDMQSFAESIGAKRKKRDQELLELSLTPAELQGILDDWLAFDYHHKKHSGLKDMTPFQVYAESGYRPRVPANPHSLDLLLNYVGTATVIRGSVSVNSVKYTAPELMESAWDRRTVRVFLDPSDVGRATLYPSDSWGDFVEAINMDLIGRDIDPGQFRERRKEATKTLREFKRTAEQLQEKFGINELAAVELAQKKLANQSLIGFNRPGQVSDNEAIAALSQSATSLLNKSAEPVYSEAELKAIAARRAEIDRRREQLTEQSSKVLRSEHEQAEFLTRESLVRELTSAEADWLKKFRSTHVMTRKRLDRILEEGKRANG